MPDNSVTTHFFADSKDAEEAYTRMEKKLDDLASKQKHAHSEGKHGAHETKEKIGEIGKEMLGVIGISTTLGGMFDGLVESAREWNKETAAAADNIERATVKFKARTGESDEVLEKVRATTGMAGLEHATGEQLFGDLKAKGFKGGEAGLEGFGDTAAAFKLANMATGVDSASFASAMARSMDQSAPKTAEAQAKAARDVANLTRGEAGATADDISSMSDTLQTAKKGKGGLFNPMHAQALNMMKLKFEDVDLQGEDIGTAMGRIKEGLKNVKVEDQKAVLKLLTGDAMQADRMLKSINAMDQNDARYDKDVQGVTSGRGAQSIRLKNEKEERAAKADGNFNNRAEVGEARAQRDNWAGGWAAGFRRKLADSARVIGDDFAIGLAYGDVQKKNLGADQDKAALRESGAGYQELVELQREGNDLLREANGQRGEGNKGKPKRGDGEE